MLLVTATAPLLLPLLLLLLLLLLAMGAGVPEGVLQEAQQQQQQQLAVCRCSWQQGLLLCWTWGPQWSKWACSSCTCLQTPAAAAAQELANSSSSSSSSSRGGCLLHWCGPVACTRCMLLW
jgi:hypothetical protein